MFTAFASLSGGNENFAAWFVFGGVLLWMLYMMTFRTDDWFRLVKEDRERKEKLFKGAFHVARWWFKK